MGSYNHARQVFCRFSFFSLHCTVALVKSLGDSTPEESKEDARVKNLEIDQVTI
jgi:hypothetical protein